ncbi:rhodanese-like domain-containing protein [Acidobacteria bacterium AB60]|nr:rhodanese-like domain-containing protein [Acidobacteria bacterium AB60]
MRIGQAVFTLAFAAGLLMPRPPAAVGQAASAAISATTIPEASQMQPADLAKILASGGAKPLILQVGPKVFFEESHIKGAKYAGPGSRPEGLQLLEKTVASVPKDAPIVIYCGCCPWNKCPNVGPAFARLHDLGYSNVKVLYLANNYGDDWARKGYPRE